MLYEAYWYFGGLKLKAGDLREAAELYLRASSVRGDDLQSKMMLMSTYHGLGREADVRRVADETFTIAARRLDLTPDDARAAYIGAQALIHLHDTPRALQWLNTAARIDSENPRTAYNLACGYSHLGETERALDMLEISIENGRSIATLDWAKIDPDLAAVRDHPRFSALVAYWIERAARTRSASA
jgi:tetratricopeptide (TPR) repeat protein